MKPGRILNKITSPPLSLMGADVQIWGSSVVCSGYPGRYNKGNLITMLLLRDYDTLGLTDQKATTHENV